jgi:hypothetical protein
LAAETAAGIVGKWSQMRPMPELVAAPDAGKFTTWPGGRTLYTSAKPFLDARAPTTDSMKVVISGGFIWVF